MNLVLSGDFARHILAMVRKDGKLAEAMAQQFLGSIDPAALAGYLLTPEVATALLAERIKRSPEGTLAELQRQLGHAPVLSADGRRGGGSVRLRSGRGARRSRHRLSPAEVAQIKDRITRFLAQHPWSSRRQISGAVQFPSLAAYNRIMTELRQEGAVASRGEKAKAAYALSSSASSQAAQ